MTPQLSNKQSLVEQVEVCAAVEFRLLGMPAHVVVACTDDDDIRLLGLADPEGVALAVLVDGRWEFTSAGVERADDPGDYRALEATGNQVLWCIRKSWSWFPTLDFTLILLANAGEWVEAMSECEFEDGVVSSYKIDYVESTEEYVTLRRSWTGAETTMLDGLGHSTSYVVPGYTRRNLPVVRTVAALTTGVARVSLTFDEDLKEVTKGLCSCPDHDSLAVALVERVQKRLAGGVQPSLTWKVEFSDGLSLSVRLADESVEGLDPDDVVLADG